MPKNKCADRGRECFWPDLDEAINEWVLNQRKCGFIVTRNMIRIAALRMTKEKAINNFKGAGVNGLWNEAIFHFDAKQKLLKSCLMHEEKTFAT